MHPSDKRRKNLRGFEKGNRANPGGRPKTIRSLAEIVNAYDGTQTLELTTHLRDQKGKSIRYQPSADEVGPSLSRRLMAWLAEQLSSASATAFDDERNKGINN